ncbi:hypothetical protein D3C75_1167030 [compost metagenome]
MLQGDIPDIVPPCIVNSLEVVYIQRQRTILLLALVEDRQRRVHAPAVDQPGQRVTFCSVVQVADLQVQ